MKYNAVGTRENVKIIDTSKSQGIQIDIMEYQKLLGATSYDQAMQLEFMEKQGVRTRQVVVYLENNSVKTEAGDRKSVV